MEQISAHVQSQGSYAVISTWTPQFVLLCPTAQGSETSCTDEGAGTAAGFDVNKVGDARVGLVGFPSVGKSTLLTKLTGTMSEVGNI
jgi:predicted GTPase